MPAATRQLAILPWGDLFEDFLDPIGVSLESFASETTGGWLFGYVEALKRAKVETSVILITARVSAPRELRHNPTGCRILLLPARPLYRRLRRRIADPYALRPEFGRRALLLGRLLPYFNTPLRLLRKALRAQGAEAILVQEYEYARFDQVALLARRMGLPLFATFQGGNRPFSDLEARIRPWTLRQAAGLLVYPAVERERIRRCYDYPPGRLHATPNPLDCDLWQPLDKLAARAVLGFSPEERIVAWHGRVERYHKGLDLLLEAWRALASLPDVRLLLIGSGRDASWLREEIERHAGRITWIDRYLNDRPTLIRYLSAADLAVLPSRHEGFAVAPLEAMACGLPLVAAEVSGVSDLLPSGEASGGILVPPGDAAALVRGIEDLLDDPRRRQHIAAAARRRVTEGFSLDTVGAALSAVIFPTPAAEVGGPIGD